MLFGSAWQASAQPWRTCCSLSTRLLRMVTLPATTRPAAYPVLGSAPPGALRAPRILLPEGKFEMTRTTLRNALVLSLLVNVGILAAAV